MPAPGCGPARARASTRWATPRPEVADEGGKLGPRGRGRGQRDRPQQKERRMNTSSGVRAGGGPGMDPNGGGGAMDPNG